MAARGESGGLERNPNKSLKLTGDSADVIRKSWRLVSLSPGSLAPAFGCSR